MPFTRTPAGLQRLAQNIATNKPVADAALKKTAIGRRFKAGTIAATGDVSSDGNLSAGGDLSANGSLSAVGLVESGSEFRSEKPLSAGTTILRHVPPDGHEIRLSQSSSDNSFQIINGSSGNTLAWFYSNGRAYVNLLDASILNGHIPTDELLGNRFAPETITGGRLAPETVTGGRVLDRTLGGIKIAVETLESGNLASGAANNRVINNTAVTFEKLNSDTKSKSQEIPSLRAIAGPGSSLFSAAHDHTHLSVNFNSAYTLAEKEQSSSLVSQVQAMTVQPQLAALRDLVLDMAHQLMDEPGMSVQEKVRLLKEDPAYAHDFRMRHDSGYYAAFMMDNNPQYAAAVEHDPRIQDMAAKARNYYGGVENDPAIVADYKRRNGREFIIPRDFPEPPELMDNPPQPEEVLDFGYEEVLEAG